jgi:hypothetical protein
VSTHTLTTPRLPGVLVASLFERIEVREDGEWNLIGSTTTFDLTVVGHGPIPATHVTAHAALLLDTRRLTGEHEVFVRLFDPADRQIHDGWRLPALCDSNGWRAPTDPIVMEFPESPLPGIYELRVSFDGHPLVAIPFQLRLRRVPSDLSGSTSFH